MNEQDKQAFEAAFKSNDWHCYEAIDIWKTALEYALWKQEPVEGVVLSSDGPSLVKRGTERNYIARHGGSLLYTHSDPAFAQEPVAWLDDYNACKCPDNPNRCFSDRVFRMMEKHTHPAQPVQPAVNEQLLEALKSCKQQMEYMLKHSEWYAPSDALELADDAIAAAEAAKGAA